MSQPPPDLIPRLQVMRDQREQACPPSPPSSLPDVLDRSLFPICVPSLVCFRASLVPDHPAPSFQTHVRGRRQSRRLTQCRRLVSSLVTAAA